MKRILAILLAAALLLPTVAQATTYYLNGDTGSDSKLGTPSALAWKTLAHANASVASGDVVVLERIRNGNYQGNIDPACQASATGWVTYVGDILHPEYATVTGGTITKPYVSIKGVAFTNGFTPQGSRDSVQYCTMTGVWDWAKAQYSFFGNNTHNGYSFKADARGWTGRTVGNVFNTCLFPSLFASTQATKYNEFEIIAADSITIESCVFDMKPLPAVHPSYQFALEHSSYVKIHNSRFNFWPNDVTEKGWGDRDSVVHCSYVKDSMIVMTTSGRPFRYELTAGGNDLGYRSNADNTLDSCYIINPKEPLRSQYGLCRWTITHNVIVSGGNSAFDNSDCGVWIGPNNIDHNTFASMQGDDTDPGILSTYSAKPMVDATRVTNNIIYGFAPPVLDDWKHFCGGPQWVAASYDSLFAATWTDGGGGSHSNHLNSDHNLYAYFGVWRGADADSIGKPSIRFRFPGGDPIGAWPGRSAKLRRPSTFAQTLDYHPVMRGTEFYGGDTTYAVTQTETAGWFIPDTLWQLRWCVGCDDSSRFGSPMFVDSVYSRPGEPWPGASFDPRLGKGSLAVGGGVSGTDIGAIANTYLPKMNAANVPLRFVDGPEQTHQRDSLIVYNTGEADLSVSAVSLHGLAGLSVATTLPLAVTAGSYAVLAFDFNPTLVPGDRNGYVTISGTSPTKPSLDIQVVIRGVTHGEWIGE